MMRKAIAWARPPLYRMYGSSDAARSDVARIIRLAGNDYPDDPSWTIDDAMAGASVAGSQWTVDYTTPWYDVVEERARDASMEVPALVLFNGRNGPGTSDRQGYYLRALPAGGATTMQRVQSTVTMSVRDVDANTLQLGSAGVDAQTTGGAFEGPIWIPTARPLAGGRRRFTPVNWRARWQLQVDFSAAAPAITELWLRLTPIILIPLVQ